MNAGVDELDQLDELVFAGQPEFEARAANHQIEQRPVRMRHPFSLAPMTR